ncbi:MAG: DUF3604 domain-containing protein [Pseudomonadota bacterium]
MDNTVDGASTAWASTIGGSELNTVWTDADFDASQPAFCYARIIEIPIPRWIACDAIGFDV